MSEADGRTASAQDPDEPADTDGNSGFFTRLKGFFGRSPEDAAFAADLDDGQREAARRLPRARREMIERVIAFDEKRVSDVMAPRADVIAVDIETPLDALIKAFADAGHSRLPVYRGDLDDPVGMAHIKDVVGIVANPASVAGGAGPILTKIRRDVLYVPPSMRITDLLLRMQASRIHMAIVIDEFGGTDGLVTIEDLVEEIVGDINDEHDDEEEPTIVARPGGGWEADGRVEFEDFAEATGIVLESEDDEVDTLGGLVFSLAGRVPQRGEVLSHPSGYDFEVAEADARKVRKIRIRKTLLKSTDTDKLRISE
jgi:CBS domain containing-hemolysin-like protein